MTQRTVEEKNVASDGDDNTTEAPGRMSAESTDSDEPGSVDGDEATGFETAGSEAAVTTGFEAAEPAGSRRPGRPRKNVEPAFPVDEVDRLLVHGEAGPDGLLYYPTYRDLGKRYGVAHSVIADYSKAHNCLNRRHKAEEQVRLLADRKLIELRAEKLAVEQVDLLRMIDRFLIAFEEALREGRVRCDNPSDFNLMCRLRAFVLGDPDSRHEVVRGISVEELRERYNRAMEMQAEIDANPALAGIQKPETKH
ncbi:MAG: hypothetical protein V2A73_05175 [Pseudomonadota bacterium]